MTTLLAILLLTWAAAPLMAIRRSYQPILVPVDPPCIKGDLSW